MAGPILVTGGAGFLGRHVVTQLLEAGYEVRTLQRSSDEDLSATGVETIQGSILSRGTLLEALQGCTAVCHLAGQVNRDRRMLRELMELHVEGTRNVLELAQEAQVKRVVYASTSGTIACSRDTEYLATEEDSYPEEVVQRWPYYVSKIEAERVARKKSQELELELITLNPSLLLGPGDERQSSTEDVLRVMDGKVPALPSGGVNFVDVRDVARGFVVALEKGRPGERYLLGAANWSLAKFLHCIGRLAGVKVSNLRAPNAPTRWAAMLIEPLFRIFGKIPPLDVVSVEMSQCYWYFDSTKAHRELGWSTRPPEETLRDTIEDLKRRGRART